MIVKADIVSCFRIPCIFAVRWWWIGRKKCGLVSSSSLSLSFVVRCRLFVVVVIVVDGGVGVSAGARHTPLLEATTS